MKTIGIFCGGFSSEFEISLKSASTILQHIPSSFSAYKIIVSREKWEVETEEGRKAFNLNDCEIVYNVNYAIDDDLMIRMPPLSDLIIDGGNKKTKTQKPQ